MKAFVTPAYRAIILLFAAFPLLYPTFAAFAFQIAPTHIASLLLSFSFWFVSVLTGITAYALWNTQRWGWYAFLGVNAMISYYGLILITNHGPNERRWIALLIQFALQIVLVLRVRSELRVPYFLPRIRWWESNPAYKVAFHCEVISPHQTPVKGDILDFANAGCFIRTMGHFRQEEAVTLSATLFGRAIQVPAIVTWRASERVTHPKGIGLKFSGLKREDRKVMIAIHKRFREIHLLFRSSRYLYSPEEFNDRLQKLFDLPLKLKLARTDKKQDASDDKVDA